MRRTIIAVFDDASTAHHVVSELVSAGIPRNDISLAVHDPDERGAKTLRGEHVDAGEGAAFGGVIGGLTGLLVGMGALAVPGVGPILAAGPLVSALAGAGIGMGAGAVTGGLVGALIDLGVPEEEAGAYAEAVRQGSTLISATVHDHELDRATQIIRQHNPINMEQRVTQWRAKGWETFDPNIDPYTAEELSDETEEARQPAAATASAGTSTGADYTPRAYSTGFDTYYDRFHQHYDENVADSGMSFEQCMPAYRQGYYMGVDPAYRSRDWSQVEPEAQQAWERSYPQSPWENFKDMVRHAWEQVKDAVD